MGLFDGLLGQLVQGAVGQTGQEGLGGLIGSILGGQQVDGASGGLAAVLLPEILSWIQQQGGVENALSTLQSSGLEDQVQSWLGGDTSQGIDPQMIDQVLGSDQVADIAAKIGLSPEDVQNGVAAILPHVINHLTPDGEASDSGESGSLLTSALGKLFG